MTEEPKKVSIEWDIDTKIAIGSLAPLAQRLESSITQSTKNIIISNERLSLSNDKHSEAMKLLTIVLVLTAVAQAFFTYAQFKIGETAIDVQRDGNSTEYVKWKYEMMRDDRLEARDIEWRKQDLEQIKQINK